MEINKPVSSAIIFIVTLLLVFLFVMPKYQESHDVEMKLAKKESEYNGQSTYYKKVSDLAVELQSRKDSLVKIDSALPASFSMSELVYFLQKKGAESGLDISTVNFVQASNLPNNAQPAQNQTNQSIKTTLFTMNVSGSYESLKKMLVSLEQSARIFEVSSISFDAGSGGSKGYSFKLEIKTHSY